MSREIDAGVKKLLGNLKPCDNERVFHAIAELISQRRDKLLEIELLGEGFPLDRDAVFLQEDACIAISKLRLLQAFLFARGVVLPGNRQPEPAAGLRDEWPATQSVTETDVGAVRRPEPPPDLGQRGCDEVVVMRATGVMLLMDPEHLTAANTRKRLLLGQGRNVLSSSSSIILATTATAKTLSIRSSQTLQDEKYFIDSLLTSRLHRHTKSPTLWSHRQWLMERFHFHGLDLDILQTLKTVILVSAERHPRNYYAWTHARYLLGKVLRGPWSAETAAARIVGDVVDAVKGWAFAHHDDISGWAFLLFLLQQRPEHAAPVVAETLELAASFGWTNESVWYFLRNVIGQQRGRQRRREEDAEGIEVEVESQETRRFRAMATALLGRKGGAGSDDGVSGRRVLERALRWAES